MVKPKQKCEKNPSYLKYRLFRYWNVTLKWVRIEKNSDFIYIFLSWGRNRLPSIDTATCLKDLFHTLHQAKFISQQAAQCEVSFIWYHSFIFSRALWDTLTPCFACWDMLTWNKIVLFYLSKYIRTVHPLMGPCVQLM